jgi:hypothetical protein
MSSPSGRGLSIGAGGAGSEGCSAFSGDAERDQVQFAQALVEARHQPRRTERRRTAVQQ